MSTQRRENRWQRPSCADRAGASSVLSDVNSLGQRILEHVSSTPGTRFGRAVASGGTAPLLSIVWLAFAWLATNSLLSDLRTRMPVRLVLLGIPYGLPPVMRAGPRAITDTSAKRRLSIPHIPNLPGSTRVHPTLPQAPAGRRRWAERYDGKRDMYFQHAA
jgi:hypothetical protein